MSAVEVVSGTMVVAADWEMSVAATTTPESQHTMTGTEIETSAAFPTAVQVRAIGAAKSRPRSTEV